MCRYEEGLPPVNIARQPKEEEEITYKKLIVKIGKEQHEVKIPSYELEEFKRIAKERLVSIPNLIGQSMIQTNRIASLSNAPGTKVLIRYPDGSEQPIIVTT